jgi:excisionase family DNA binding protein
MQRQPHAYMTIGATAAYFDVSPSTVKHWVKTGILVFIRIRRVVRINVEASEALLRKHGYLQ